MHNDAHSHPGDHQGEGSTARESPRPAGPSLAVMVDVGEHTGALVLKATAEREGLEVEIHPASDPSQRTHVWVLPRSGRDGTVYAAVFPRLPAGDYTVLEPDGTIAMTAVGSAEPGHDRHLGIDAGNGAASALAADARGPLKGSGRSRYQPRRLRSPSSWSEMACGSRSP